MSVPFGREVGNGNGVCTDNFFESTDLREDGSHLGLGFGAGHCWAGCLAEGATVCSVGGVWGTRRRLFFPEVE